MGSASELKYFLLLAKDLRMLDVGRHQETELELLEIREMRAGLLERLGS